MTEIKRTAIADTIATRLGAKRIDIRTGLRDRCGAETTFNDNPLRDEACQRPQRHRSALCPLPPCRTIDCLQERERDELSSAPTPDDTALLKSPPNSDPL